jgi:hypothetical protein
MRFQIIFAIVMLYVAGDLAYREHGGGHTGGPNWAAFMTFAQRYLKGPGLK